METLKKTMEENNTYLIIKIDTKMESMFKEFQTYLMRTTTEIVQNLQTNKPQPMNNIARLSHIYDATTN